jgi:hypothetical protein
MQTLSVRGDGVKRTMGPVGTDGAVCRGAAGGSDTSANGPGAKPEFQLFEFVPAQIA